MCLPTEIKSISSSHRCFRLNDLEQGEVIGHGFYGSVYKVGVSTRRALCGGHVTIM